MSEKTPKVPPALSREPAKGDSPIEPVAVVLDTSVLRKEVSAYGGALDHLVWSVQKGAVRVLVPELVLRELVTGLAKVWKDWVEDTNEEPRKALSWFTAGDTKKSAETAHTKLVELETHIEKTLADGVAARMKDLQAEILPITESATRVAWDMYFSGSGPMKQPKSRGDLPDAFIAACALEAQDRLGEPIHFVAHDVALRKGLPKDRFIVHETIGSFNSSEAVKDVVRLIDQLANAAAWRDHVREALRQQTESIESGVEDTLENVFQGQEVRASFLPSDDGDGRLSGGGSIDKLQFDFRNLEDLGRDAVLVPATIDVVDALVDLFIFKADYWALPEDESERIRVYDHNWNDHTVAAEIYVDLTVECIVRVDLETDENEVVIVASASVEEVKSIELKEPDWFMARMNGIAQHRNRARATPTRGVKEEDTSRGTKRKPRDRKT